MIEKFRLNRFCCCCTIRTGSLVIGVFGWIGSLLHSITLTTPHQKTTIRPNEDGSITLEEESSSNVGTILLSIFMFGMSVSLVIGIYKENRRFILPWLIVKFLECCVLTIATIVLFFMLFVMEDVGILFLLFAIIAGFSALFWYCWICVWSLYMDMGENNMTIMPMGQSIPMTEPIKQQYPMSESPSDPPQAMV